VWLETATSPYLDNIYRPRFARQHLTLFHAFIRKEEGFLFVFLPVCVEAIHDLICYGGQVRVSYPGVRRTPLQHVVVGVGGVDPVDRVSTRRIIVCC
jgi:hypothetical protein